MPVRATRSSQDDRPADPFAEFVTDQEQAWTATKPAGHFDSGTRRLWRPLSYRPARPEEIEDLDKFGDRLIGFLNRARYRRESLRLHANNVASASEKLADLAERGLDDEIKRAQSNARRGRRDLEARTHAFAVVREVIRRTIGLRLYVEQIMGGWVMEDGCIAEMLTGEGKTVTACLTAAVQGWTGYGVHIITVNDYLARRDAEINRKVYKRLGLSVGVIQDQSTDDDRRDAYRCDVTYATDKQVIFDLLRDRLRTPTQPRLTSLLLEEICDTDHFRTQGRWTDRLVMRGLHAAVIDEADSVLIDEATTPAVIAGHGGEDRSSEFYQEAAQIADQLVEREHFDVDRSQHRVDLTERGKDRLAEVADRLPPFWSGPRRREELIVRALTAKHLFALNDHYIVRNDDVHIVDPGTGRVLEGRQWQLGLHQAVQAKEGLAVTRPNETMARISYSRFFQMYERLAGMTGTAWEVRHELWRNYRLPVVRIPTHKPMIRTHLPDRVFVTQAQKFDTVARRVAELHATGQPVLIGTRSVEASEELSRRLDAEGVLHRVLNAVRHEEEAAIVAAAGQRGAVTVATNMAGRGTDITLGPGVADLGGLAIIATERHDSYRIDRQLYGRSARQGDPGLAEAFVSLDDQLVVVSGIQWLRRWLMKSPIPRRLGLSRVLWSLAQGQASRRQVMARAMASKHDLWFDRALHFENR